MMSDHDVLSVPVTRSKPNINVTPLIDVLLVMLIIFMVAAPLKPQRFGQNSQNQQNHHSSFTLIRVSSV